MICQILQLFANILTANDKYPVLNRDKLTITIQMRLSQKQKIFSEIFSPFLKARLDFRYFESKHDPDRFCISEITESENLVR